MGEKVNQVRWARHMQRRDERLAERLAVDAAMTSRRERAVANIQLRIMKRLVNVINRDGGQHYPGFLNSLDCTSEQWDDLVATLNVAE